MAINGPRDLTGKMETQNLNREGIFQYSWRSYFWCLHDAIVKPRNKKTRRLAACTQAVVQLRSTRYTAIELNVLHYFI